jgi:hypothetical protein
VSAVPMSFFVSAVPMSFLVSAVPMSFLVEVVVVVVSRFAVIALADKMPVVSTNAAAMINFFMIRMLKYFLFMWLLNVVVGIISRLCLYPF